LLKSNHFGPLHIIVEDWNLDDDSIEFCSQDETMERHWSGPMSATDRALLDLLRPMTVTQRATALALADGYLNGDGSYDDFAIQCGAPA